MYFWVIGATGVVMCFGGLIAAYFQLKEWNEEMRHALSSVSAGESEGSQAGVVFFICLLVVGAGLLLVIVAILGSLNSTAG